MMTKPRKIIGFILFILGVFVCFGLWYKLTYSMDLAENYEVHSKNAPQKLLIATQGSDFKNSVVQQVVSHYKKDSTYINIIDISKLDQIDPKDYNAILLIHTWENWKPPMSIENFISRTKLYQDHIVVITTSGEGSYQMDGVDAITGASSPENIVPIANRAIAQLQTILDRTL